MISKQISKGVTDNQFFQLSMPLVILGSCPATGRAAAQGASPTAPTGRHPSGSSHLHPDAALRAPAKCPGGYGG